MAKRKKRPAAPAAELPVLNDASVAQLSRAVAAMFGPTVLEQASKYGVSVEDVVRLLP